MSVFHFKRFDIINEASSMKVNTDGVLLGAAATIAAGDCRVLDAGTGTGTIALMLAQRYSGLHEAESDLPDITGIDIDTLSAQEASANFLASPWSLHLSASSVSLQDHHPAGRYDLIVSNPPFFESSLLPPERRRGMARHTAGEALSFESLIGFAADHLSDEGRISMILPSMQEQAVVRYAASFGFPLFRIMRIRTTPRKDPSRIIVEFSRKNVVPVEKELTIQDVRSYPENRNGYTPEYLALTGDFYL